MPWRQKLTDGLADWLRFFIRGALMINGIMFAVATIYLTSKLLWYSLRFLDRTIFSEPW